MIREVTCQNTGSHTGELREEDKMAFTATLVFSTFFIIIGITCIARRSKKGAISSLIGLILCIGLLYSLY